VGPHASAARRKGYAAKSSTALSSGRPPCSRRPFNAETADALSHFFIDRPIFVRGGFRSSSSSSARCQSGAADRTFPDIAPPVVRVSGQYPGASA